MAATSRRLPWWMLVFAVGCDTPGGRARGVHEDAASGDIPAVQILGADTPESTPDVALPEPEVASPEDVGAPEVAPAPDVASTGTGGTGGGTGLQTGTCAGRPWRAFVPDGLGAPAPLVIATYGFGDDNANFMNTLGGVGWLDAAKALGAIVFVPAHMNTQRPSFLYLDASGGLDWPGTRAEIEAVQSCALTGAGALWDVDTARVTWIGFSEGAVVADLAAWHLAASLRGAAPYAGAVTGKTFPIAAKVRVYFICGTADPGYAGAQEDAAEWLAAGHPTKSAWVQGAGHKLSTLCAQGPSPTDVLAWIDGGDGGEEPPPPPSPPPPGGLDPPAGDSSHGSGGGAAGGEAHVTETGVVTYRLIAPAAAGPLRLVVVYSGTEGGALMTQNLLSIASYVGLADAAIAVLDGVQYNGDGAAGAAVLDDVRAHYDIDNDRTLLLSESAGTTAGLALGFTLRQSWFAAYWANDVNASGAPAETAAELGFQPWGNAGPGGDYADANAIVAAMSAADYRTPPPAPYDGPGSDTHGSPDQFIAAMKWLGPKTRQ